MTLLLLILNFLVSWLNAWGCGKSWNETRHVGGPAHLMNWAGAVMSASGFTWCYALIGAFLGGSLTHEVDGKAVPYLSAQAVDAVCQAGYLAVILPVIGSGLAITVHSWAVFWRRRTFGDGALAGYNTFANVYNLAGAVRHVPEAGSGLGKFFDGDDKGKGLVVLIVLAAACAGVLTTYTIVTSTARSTALSRGLRYANGRA